VTAEVAVDPDQIGQISACDFRGSMVEDLRFNEALCKHVGWMMRWRDGYKELVPGMVQGLHRREFLGEED
jgi:hypothetical protein